jgi:hypothetical protein
MTVTLAVVPGAQAAGGPTESVIFNLAPKSHAVLAALAKAHNLTKQQRRAAVASVTPSAATRETVLATIAAAGLHVNAVTPWAITASAPSSVLRPALDLTPSRRGLLLPHSPRVNSPLWAQLGPAVDSIVASDGRARLQPRSPAYQDGASLQTLYSAREPSNPAGATTVTVATLQFSGWNKDYLRTFAVTPTIFGGLGLQRNPIADGQYQEVAVSDGTTTADPAVPDGGGDVEVALDQEALLAVAPYANQRAYFAPNTDAGEIAALNAVANDALAGKDNIVALSISWGLCEPEMLPATMDAMHNIFQTLLAEGVTVFAASGDSGSLDCAQVSGSTHTGDVAVDSPANDPFVVGVGGTTVDVNGTQTGWADGGGGSSAYFATKPSYQIAASIPGTGRQVPDIAADADPSSGFGFYYPLQVPSWGHIGGTSLASPVMAASLANVLSIQRRTVGVGDIHSLLYTAKQGRDSTSQIVDLVDGNNGFPAGLGYDNATGLGAPLWSKLFRPTDAVPRMNLVPVTRSHTISLAPTLPAGAVASKWAAGAAPTNPIPADCTAAVATKPVSSVTVPSDGKYTVWVAELTGNNVCNVIKQTTIVDSVRPTTSASGSLISSTTSKVSFRWNSKDSGVKDAVSGILDVKVVARHAGSKVPDWSLSTPDHVASGTKTWSGVPGRTYVITVTAYDNARNASVPAVYKISVPFDDTNFTLKNWAKSQNANAYFGTWSQSASPYASATKVISARSYSVQYTACSTCGRLGVFVNGALVKSIDTYAATTKYHVTTLAFSGGAATRAISIRPLGTKSGSSHGFVVKFDGLLALP